MRPLPRSFALVSLAVVTAACGGGAATPAPAPASPTSATAAPPKIAFIEDDYPRALAEARAKKRPIFVDAWAPWCHTCLSLREFTFPDPQIRARAADFVWLAIDTEKPENAAFVRKFPFEGLPTLWVIDGETETGALKWMGAANAGELAALLDDAKLAVTRGDGGGAAGAAYLRGNQETAAGKTDDAIASYRAAIAAAPAGWPKRAHAIEALSARLAAKKDYPACVALATAELPKMPPGTSAKDVAYDALGCAVKLDGDEKAARGAEVVAIALGLARDPKQSMLADDRSDLYGAIVDTMEKLGKEADTKPIAREWAAMLEAEAARATTPAARSVFDPHRLDAYLALGEPARALPMLEASEKDFPNDYNPPARLGAALFALKRYDEALAAVERALSKAYGPRKLRYYTLKADILAAKGDKAGEKATVDEALAHARGLLLTGSAAKTRDKLEERAKKLR